MAKIEFGKTCSDEGPTAQNEITAAFADYNTPNFHETPHSTCKRIPKHMQPTQGAEDIIETFSSDIVDISILASGFRQIFLSIKTLSISRQRQTCSKPSKNNVTLIEALLIFETGIENIVWRVFKDQRIRSEFLGLKEPNGMKTKASIHPCQINVRKCKTVVHCSFDSSSNDSGSMAENFNENDEDYVNSSVIEAVEVKSGADGFIIKMRDGRHLRCVHNNPQGGHLPDYAPHPSIVLKMEDGTDLLLPIIVLEMPSVLLMAAIRNVHIVRPTLYQVVKEMIDKMGYEVKIVRITKRVHEAYFARLYLTKGGDEAELMSFDLRPSDAINIAVRCKVPIQVNKFLAYSDGMRVIESGKLSTQSPGSDGLLFTELDRPSGKPCAETKEFNLLHNMWKAVYEERYKDAALWRDRLNQLRAGKNVDNRSWTL
ncbi:hypothetical protein L6164_024787 [Bauhinia variegata]|uniref:Uncharacterized protein n=1 Tax=Bauhinia variegata TaxID=167791 RepID=A0ACB9M013_BAUVA|nr:hypothetical protein L6164_024787 [Bauhinia variegata]